MPEIPSSPCSPLARFQARNRERRDAKPYSAFVYAFCRLTGDDRDHAMDMARTNMDDGFAFVCAVTLPLVASYTLLCLPFKLTARGLSRLWYGE